MAGEPIVTTGRKDIYQQKIFVYNQHFFVGINQSSLSSPIALELQRQNSSLFVLSHLYTQPLLQHTAPHTSSLAYKQKSSPTANYKIASVRSLTICCSRYIYIYILQLYMQTCLYYYNYILVIYPYSVQNYGPVATVMLHSRLWLQFRVNSIRGSITIGYQDLLFAQVVIIIHFHNQKRYIVSASSYVLGTPMGIQS